MAARISPRLVYPVEENGSGTEKICPAGTVNCTADPIAFPLELLKAIVPEHEAVDVDEEPVLDGAVATFATLI